MRYRRYWRAGFIIASAVGIFPAVSARSQTDAPEVDANPNLLGRTSVLGLHEPITIKTNDNLNYGVANETPSESDEADKLAKQLSNPVSSLISVPFQGNEDFGFGPSHNGYKFTLNIQPVIPISISKDWNLVLRTIFPIVSQHDLVPVWRSLLCRECPKRFTVI